MLWKCIAALLAVVALPTGVAAKVAAAARVERAIVHKKDRVLELFSGGHILKSYKVALGPNPIGTKQRQGDGRTPEGVYVLDWRNAQSQFYKSIHVSYPNAQDRAAAKKAGVSPGGDIFVHGLGKKWGWVGAAHRAHDWTAVASR